MGIAELLDWQWSGYSRYHRSRANLLMHIVVVPMFLAGNIGLLAAAVTGSWLLALASAVAMIVSLAVQGRGHGGEPVPPEPFTGRTNAVSRILLEQWVTFPRFVLSGGWYRALRESGAP
jgi:hypothetical protein